MGIKRVKRFREERGFILITLYLLLVVLLVYATALISQSFADLRGAQRFQASNQAFYLAEAGVDQAWRWLRNQGNSPGGTQVIVLNGNVNQGWQPLGQGHYQASLTPDPNNPVSFIKRYTLEGRGQTGHDATAPDFLFSERRVRFIVQTESFSRFAYFTNSEINTSGNRIWFITGDHITGPTHTNGQFNMFGAPVFDGPVSSVASSLNLWGAGPPVFNDGLQLGAPAINLPPVVPANLQNEASAHGLLLNGDTTLTLQSGGTMQVTNTGSHLKNAVLPLPGDGVLYVKGGNVTLQGTLKGQLTIATDRDVQISNSVTYTTPPANPTATDLLGIVAGGNVVVTKGAPQNVQIDGSIMALGSSFTVQSYNVGPPKGTLTVYGGIIQDKRGAVGTFNSNTGSKVSGYTKDYHYDNRLETMVPPFFPTTGNYTPVVWEERE